MDRNIPSLNIGVRSQEVNSSFNSGGIPFNTTGGTSAPSATGIDPLYARDYSGPPVTVTGVGTGVNAFPFPNCVGSVGGSVSNVTAWAAPRTAVGDFLKIQYAEVEVRCAITRKMVPAGSPVMLLGGMVISQEAFEKWLEGHLAELIGRHQDLHMNKYDDEDE
jgi:hypothetical protein